LTSDPNTPATSHAHTKREYSPKERIEHRKQGQQAPARAPPPYPSSVCAYVYCCVSSRGYEPRLDACTTESRIASNCEMLSFAQPRAARTARYRKCTQYNASGQPSSNIRSAESQNNLSRLYAQGVRQAQAILGGMMLSALYLCG